MTAQAISWIWWNTIRGIMATPATAGLRMAAAIGAPLASGAPMAAALFPAAVAGVALLPLMVFHQIQLMACAVIAQAYARRPDTEPASG